MISVIIPVYNVEQYLKTCIDSVLHQTYRDIEIILVDDGSTDSSGQICKEYANAHPNIRLIQQANGGISVARNAALDVAKGEYIYFLDSDDYIAPNALSRLHQTLSQAGADLVLCNYRRITNEHEVLEENPFFPSDSPKEVWLTEEQFWELTLTNLAPTVVASKLYPRKLWDTLRFPEGKIHEDVAVLHHILSKCSKIVCIDEFLLNYRYTPKSIMNTAFRPANLDFCEVLLPRLEYFQTKRNLKLLHAYFGVGTRTLLKGYRLLDTKDSAVALRLKSLYRQYIPYAKFLARSEKGLYTRLRMFLFYHCLPLYDKMQGLHSKQ